MQVFTMFIRWPEGIASEQLSPLELDAMALPVALAEARQSFDTLQFGAPPCGFHVVDQAGATVFDFGSPPRS